MSVYDQITNHLLSVEKLVDGIKRPVIYQGPEKIGDFYVGTIFARIRDTKNTIRLLESQLQDAGVSKPNKHRAK